MTERPGISFNHPYGLFLAFGLSTGLWAMLACAVVVLSSPDPKAYLPDGLRHFGHELRVHVAEAYNAYQG